METKRGSQDHETPIIQDLLKILKRWFRLKTKGKKTVLRGDFTFDQFIELGEVIQKPLPPILKFLENKKILICEVKTPGMYLDLPILTQMTNYQGAALDRLQKRGQLKWEELNQTVMLTLVSKFSDSAKEKLKENEIPFELVEKGLYRFPYLLKHFVFVIDELDFDAVIFELLKYTKDSSRLRKMIDWLRKLKNRNQQKEMLFDMVQTNPHIRKEVIEMLPVSNDPNENREYIYKVFEGFGLGETVDYAIEKSEDEVARRLIEKGKVPAFFNQLLQSGLSPEDIPEEIFEMIKKWEKP